MHRSLAKHRRLAVECELGALRGVAAHVSVAHPLEIGPWHHAHARPCVELGLNVCREEFCRDKGRGAKQTAGVAADSPHSRCYDVLPVGGVFEARPADRGAAVRHKIGVGRGAHVIRAVAAPASVERILIVGVAGIVCVWRRLHARSGDAIGPRSVCRTLSEHTVGVGMAVRNAVGGKGYVVDAQRVVGSVHGRRAAVCEQMVLQHCRRRDTPDVFVNRAPHVESSQAIHTRGAHVLLSQGKLARGALYALLAATKNRRVRAGRARLAPQPGMAREARPAPLTNSPLFVPGFAAVVAGRRAGRRRPEALQRIHSTVVAPRVGAMAHQTRRARRGSRRVVPHGVAKLTDIVLHNLCIRLVEHTGAVFWLNVPIRARHRFTCPTVSSLAGGARLALPGRIPPGTRRACGRKFQQVVGCVDAWLGAPQRDAAAVGGRVRVGPRQLPRRDQVKHRRYRGRARQAHPVASQNTILARGVGLTRGCPMKLGGGACLAGHPGAGLGLVKAGQAGRACVVARLRAGRAKAGVSESRATLLTRRAVGAWQARAGL